MLWTVTRSLLIVAWAGLAYSGTQSRSCRGGIISHHARTPTNRAKKAKRGRLHLAAQRYHPSMATLKIAKTEARILRDASPGKRSEERRVGKECRCRWALYPEEKSNNKEI